MIKAVYDACVLYSASLRDFLLRLADEELLVPSWSKEIQEEWMRNLLKNRSDIQRDRIERTQREMDRAFPQSLLTDYKSIIPQLHLPDPNDRHVLAVAIKAGAEFIVTFNLSDFPSNILSKYGIEAISPDDFVLRLIQHDQTLFLHLVADHRSVLKHPPKSVDEYLHTLEKQRLPKTVAFLREHRNEI